MYFVKSPFFLRWLYPKSIWHLPREKKKVYLTFDDGPIPEITPFILDILKKYQVKATFFCVGENIKKNPELFQRILLEGHQVGNHTYNHLKGWDTSDSVYLDNVAQCQLYTQTDLFRPPYAKAKKSQLKTLYKDYRVIMWDIMSGDFDQKLSPHQCLQNILPHIKNGSVIIFHDNIKSIPRVKYALPKTIEFLLAHHYQIERIE